MKLFNMNFSKKERAFFIFLLVLLVGLAYYQFVDRPVRKSLEIYATEEADLSLELTTIQAKLVTMRKMRNEMSDVGQGLKEMGSYNNSKVEIEILNNILSEAPDYSISFANVTREGDQIRRNFSLQFTAPSYEIMEHIFSQLAECQFRCLIGDIRCGATVESDVQKGAVSVSATATFFETMVGGTPDAGLPADSAAIN